MGKSIKNVGQVIPPPRYHMVGDGFRVHNFFPSDPKIGLGGMSPFFLLDYGSKWQLPPSDHQRGVGVHPHRGFETVTVAYHGKIAHHDSAGNSGVIGEGDIQWMTAGVGVLHKEYHEKEFSKKGGLMQMVQLWVNLPAKYKMTPAKYQPIKHNELAIVSFGKGKSKLELIAGTYVGKAGPASTFTEMNLFNAKIADKEKINLSFNKMFNTGLLVIEGKFVVNDSVTASEDQFVHFLNDGENFTLEAIGDSIALVLSGEPIDEPIVPYGPFVMNTEAEIRQAFNDFNNGKFGYLED